MPNATAQPEEVSTPQGTNRVTAGLFGWAGHFRWPLLSVAVGLVSGCGAILFEELLRLALYFFLHLPTGFLEPSRREPTPPWWLPWPPTAHWLYLLIPALGGLISGVLVFLIAPEAGGHGTDAMIESFHHQGRLHQKTRPLC